MNTMPTPRKLHRGARQLERVLDRLRPAGRTGKGLTLSPYRGFGRGHELFVRGRVLEEKNITRSSAAEALWRDVLNTYRRFQSDEVPGARVLATYRDAVVESTTDEEGHFRIRLEPREIDAQAVWHEVGLKLPDTGVTGTAHVLVPSLEADFAVLSDIDDTIVRTNATSLVGMVRSVVRNAAARLPFEGVSALYEALHRGRNPIFYVSSSPWNLYELLHDFMALQKIPHGPMFLQDWGIDEHTFLLASHRQHKLEQIRLLLDYYPELRFVMIGDSGQHDPEIYLEVIRSHPERILAAIIRDVTDAARDEAVNRITDEARSAGVEMVFVQDSSEAMQHASRLGLI